jgi:Transposase and inactivated derivatives
MSVSEAFRLLKGASSYRLFRKKPNFRKRYPRGHFWSPGKFYRSVGDADLETTRNYVRNQKTVHQMTLPQFF